MKKKGFLLAETTLKLILAVIAIGFLAFFLASLYNANRTSNELELAKESLNHLFEEINAERAQVEIYNPKGWFISSWSSSGEIPLSCSNLGWQSCTCICDRGIIGKFYGSEVEMCDDTGACLKNKDGFSMDQVVDIDKPPIILSIDYSSKTISEIK